VNMILKIEDERGFKNVSETIFINAITNYDTIDDNMIQKVMNSNTKPKISAPHHKSKHHIANEDNITINGVQYRKINVVKIMYRIHSQSTVGGSYSLVDCGANGGLFGADIRILHYTQTCNNNGD
jgi:hypothetical protein